MGGIRSLQLTYIPIVLASIVLFLKKFFNQEQKVSFFKSKEDTGLLLSVLEMALSFAGYYVNSRVLSEFFKFRSYNDMNYSDFSFDTLGKVIQYIFNNLGYESGRKFLSIMSLSNLCAILLAIVMITAIVLCIKKYERITSEYCFMTVFSLCVFGFVMFILIASGEVTERYVMSGMVYLILMIPSILEFVLENPKVRSCLLAALYSAAILSGLTVYQFLLFNTINSEKQGYINFLNNSSLEYGYATFWNANLVTEYTNGRVKIENVDYIKSAGEIKYLEWLQLAPDVWEKKAANMPVFFVLSSEEREILKDKLSIERCVYEDEAFSIYLFSSNNDFRKKFMVSN